MAKNEICPARDLTAKRLEQIINGYKNNTVKSAHYDEGVKLICHCASFMQLAPTKGSALIRRRKSLSKEQVVAEGCWYPQARPGFPAQGRFNEEGQSMAYFCDMGDTANKEVFGDKQEDCHSLRAVIKKDGLNVIGIFPLGRPLRFNENCFFQSTEARLAQCQREYAPELFEMVSHATTFLGEEVSKTDADYKLTNAIARGVFWLLKADGIIFASTKADLSGNNIVLQPSATDEYVAQSELFGVEYGPTGALMISEMITYKQGGS